MWPVDGFSSNYSNASSRHNKISIQHLTLKNPQINNGYIIVSVRGTFFWGGGTFLTHIVVPQRLVLEISASNTAKRYEPVVNQELT